jgi:hypothetical protein
LPIATAKNTFSAEYLKELAIGPKPESKP